MFWRKLFLNFAPGCVCVSYHPCDTVPADCDLIVAPVRSALSACWNGGRFVHAHASFCFLPGIMSRPVEKKVIGYVASGYGKTDEKEVKGHIDRYKVRVRVAESVGSRSHRYWLRGSSRISPITGAMDWVIEGPDRSAARKRGKKRPARKEVHRRSPVGKEGERGKRSPV